MAWTANDLPGMATMAALNISCTATLYICATALLAAGCTANPPATPGPASERVELGYGSLDARHVTTSVSRLDADRLGDIRVGRVEELLMGRIAGVQVHRSANGGYTVRVRGNGTGTGEPLYVVDGTPLHPVAPGQALIGINPSDVTRIVVLKDAASASIYGSQGANGVILITTRRN